MVLIRKPKIILSLSMISAVVLLIFLFCSSAGYSLDNARNGVSRGHLRKNTGEVEVDLGRYELRRFGQRIKIEKKPMELLIFLLGRREQMVRSEEIVKKLWRSDLFIDTEKNVNNVVRKLRTALGDSADQPRFLETVVGKGYRFVGPVRVIDAQYPAS